MDDDLRLRKKLDRDRKPIAIIHYGLFVYANRAFLSLLDMDSFADLEALSLLDVTVGLDKLELRRHLTLAAKASEATKILPRQSITLARKGGGQVTATMSSHIIQFAGESSILFSLRMEPAAKSGHTYQSPKWMLYLSGIYLLFFIIGPNLLLLKLNINNAPRVYLPASAPAVVADDRVREMFPSDQGIVLLFEGVALYSDGFLEAIAQLTQTLEANPLVDKVISVTNQDHISGTDDGFIVEPLVDVENLDDFKPAERRARILGDRFANRLLVAADGSALAMAVIPSAIDSSFIRMDLEEDILSAIAAQSLTGYLTAIAGQVTTDVEQTRSLIRENMVFIPATVILGLLMIWLLFRRWMAMIIGGMAIGATVNTTVSLYVLANQPFNMISSILPPLVSALTIAALVHLFNALNYHSRRGLTGTERVAAALAEIRKPALYTALTTIAGFASLGLSSIPPIRVFGLITAAGVAMTYLTVYHVTPPVFAHLDKSKWHRGQKKSGLLDQLVRWLFHGGIRHPVITLAIAVASLGVATPKLADIVVETNLLEFFSPNHKTRLATERIQEKLVGTSSLDVLFSTEAPNGLVNPAHLKQIRQFQLWAESQPEIDKSTSFSDFVEEMHWGFNAEKDSFRVIPDDPDLISQYLFIYDGDDLHDFVDENYQNTHVGLNVNVHGANDISRVLERIREYLGSEISPDLEWQVAGSGRMFAEQEDLLVSGQVLSLIGAIIIIFVLMLAQWRKWQDALICMVPNLAPILLIFILMGALGIWLDMATAMIASVAVGIAIDDTIHVYHGFNSRVNKGLSPVTALARTYRQAGRAVMTTSIILCAQFSLLVTSQFLPIAHFGLLTSTGLLTALVFDLLVLPAILIVIYQPQRHKDAAIRNN